MATGIMVIGIAILSAFMIPWIGDGTRRVYHQFDSKAGDEGED